MANLYQTPYGRHLCQVPISPYIDVTLEEHPNDHIELPVLESSTRKELYDLILGLCEDKNSYNMLLELTQGS